jgi:hypothetical protein
MVKIAFDGAGQESRVFLGGRPGLRVRMKRGKIALLNRLNRE